MRSTCSRASCSSPSPGSPGPRCSCTRGWSASAAAPSWSRGGPAAGRRRWCARWSRPARPTTRTSTPFSTPPDECTPTRGGRASGCVEEARSGTPFRRGTGARRSPVGLIARDPLPRGRTLGPGARCRRGSACWRSCRTPSRHVTAPRRCWRCWPGRPWRPADFAETGARRGRPREALLALARRANGRSRRTPSESCPDSRDNASAGSHDEADARSSRPGSAPPSLSAPGRRSAPGPRGRARGTQPPPPRRR